MKLSAWIFSPVVFGLGFLGPLLSQSLVALGIAPNTTATVIICLLLGAGYGVFAQLRGSWLWIKP